MRNTSGCFIPAMPMVLRVGAIMLCIGAMGCASAPRQYNQSAFTPAPRAPSFDPVTDSPVEIGHPGVAPIRPALEPNPKPVRVLPETPDTRRETGLWAADPATAQTPTPVMPMIKGVPLPLPSGERYVPPTHPAAVCAGWANMRLDPEAIHAKVQRLTYDQLKCLAAMMYARCTAANAGKTNTPPHSIWWRDAAAASKQFVRDECTATTHAPAVDAILAMLN